MIITDRGKDGVTSTCTGSGQSTVASSAECKAAMAGYAQTCHSCNLGTTMTVATGSMQVSGCSVDLFNDASPKGSFRFETTGLGTYTNTRNYIPICKEGTAPGINAMECQWDASRNPSAPDVDTISDKDCEEDDEMAGALIASILSTLCCCGCIFGTCD